MADTDTRAATAATRVVVSHDGDPDTDASLRKPSYRRYLQRSKAGPVDPGDVWEEFVNCGCGTTEDVSLRVERVDGGGVIDEDTDIVVERRD